MEPLEPLERIDVDRLYAEAEQLLAPGELEHLEQFLHALKNILQQYLDIEKQAAAVIRQLEQR
jgi:hypothetical protein